MSNLKEHALKIVLDSLDSYEVGELHILSAKIDWALREKRGMDSFFTSESPISFPYEDYAEYTYTVIPDDGDKTK